MNTNAEKLLLRKEVFQIVCCATEVFNTIGHGLGEKRIADTATSTELHGSVVAGVPPANREQVVL